MKRLLVVVALLAASVAFAASVFAGGQGAVKIDFDPNVGWVNLNSTASGRLIATAHLDNGAPNSVFDVSVRVRYEDGTTTLFTNVTTLTTNGQGKGNAQVRVDVGPPAGSTTLRRVAFRVRRPGPPQILYVAVAWDLPLKKSASSDFKSY
jgi:hypothetical protein